MARIQPRPLDRHRPLWEVYLVEGLEEGRFAIVTKSHQALVDGINAVDIAHVIVDDDPAAEGLITDTWRPLPRAQRHRAAHRRPRRRRSGGPARSSRTSAAEWSTSRPSAVGRSQRPATSRRPLARTAARPAPDSPLNAMVGEARRYVMIGTDLDDYRKVRSRLTRGNYADDVTINDVVLATDLGGVPQPGC